VVRFLKGDDRVKVTIMFRGREQTHPERGERLLMRLAEDVADLGTVEQSPQQDGRNMTMLLAPSKKKAEHEEQPAASDAQQPAASDAQPAASEAQQPAATDGEPPPAEPPPAAEQPAEAQPPAAAETS
jgi:translation initiation factor IF-3